MAGLMLQVFLLAVSSASAFSRHKVTPFSYIADEISAAEAEAEDLRWQVANSTSEKASIQWFLATALAEIATIKKVDFNNTINGSLAFKYEACAELTGAPMPSWDQGLTLPEAIGKDKELAPNIVEAHMTDLYEAQQREEELTIELGQCAADCPSSFLQAHSASRKIARKIMAGLAKAPAPGPAPAPGGAAAAPAGPPPPPSPKELMNAVADAIYNTSMSTVNAKEQLRKDKSAKEVLGQLSATVMGKLLQARKDMKKMHEDLDECLRTPLAAHLEGHVIEAMADNKEATLEIVQTSKESTKTAKAMVAKLEKKLAECKLRCGKALWR
jgi:hypothetical protein